MDETILGSLIQDNFYKNNGEVSLQKDRNSGHVFDGSKYTNIVEIGSGLSATVYRLIAKGLPDICKKIYDLKVDHSDIRLEYKNGLLINELSSKYTLFVYTYALTTLASEGGGIITRFLRERGLYKEKSISPFKKYFKELECDSMHNFEDQTSESIGVIHNLNILCMLAKDLHKNDNWGLFKKLFKLQAEYLQQNQYLLENENVVDSTLYNLLFTHKWIIPDYNQKSKLTADKQQSDKLSIEKKQKLLAAPALYTQYFPANTKTDGGKKTIAANWLYEGKYLPISEICSLLYQVAYVLSQIHDKFQHNDLKVDNILVYKLTRPVTFLLGDFEFSTYCIAKLIDYGVSNSSPTRDMKDVIRIYEMMVDMGIMTDDEKLKVYDINYQTNSAAWNDLLEYLKKNISTHSVTEKMIICNGRDDVKIVSVKPKPQRLHEPHWRSGGHKRTSHAKLNATRKRRRFTKKRR